MRRCRSHLPNQQRTMMPWHPRLPFPGCAAWPHMVSRFRLPPPGQLRGARCPEFGVCRPHSALRVHHMAAATCPHPALQCLPSIEGAQAATKSADPKCLRSDAANAGIWCLQCQPGFYFNTQFTVRRGRGRGAGRTTERVQPAACVGAAAGRRPA